MVFENTYKVTKRKYLGWASKSLKKRNKKTLVLWGVAAAVAAAVAAYGLLSRDLVHGSLYVVISAFCIYRGFLRMHMLVAKQFKVLQVVQGSRDWQRTITFDDKTNNIKVVDGRQTANYLYKDAAKMTEIGDYYWIFFRDGISISLDKNGFVKGTREDFIEFMKANHGSIALEMKA